MHEYSSLTIHCVVEIRLLLGYVDIVSQLQQLRQINPLVLINNKWLDCQWQILHSFILVQSKGGSTEIVVAKAIEASRMVIFPSQSYEIISVCSDVDWPIIAKGDIVIDYSSMVQITGGFGQPVISVAQYKSGPAWTFIHFNHSFSVWN